MSKEKNMYYSKVKGFIRFLVIIALVGAGAVQSNSAATVSSNPDGPELPADCGSIAVGDGFKLIFHVYAKGVQIYKWNGSAWVLDSPRASLFAEENYFGEVGTHYAGPQWESKSGSKVKAQRVLGTGCTPDPSAVAWLLLKKVETSGAGVFGNVELIQRTNTVGGLAPVELGSLNEIREVPYTAEYWFYRAEGPTQN
jgi:hypothetical protein